MSEQENSSLMQVAGKILEQQTAAERVAQAINVTMPTHGQKLIFKRSLQIKPNADMIVSFKVSNAAGLRWLMLFLAIGMFAAFYRLMLGGRRA